ncbi:periplasmic copper-binding protein NosD [Leptospira broomii serovar Hurstbridge str. 5399]|uniref:Periplasmic copper-binding protein NosD n=1 Tax=Leptospira broomii serovar Hurstbridge str. 5399 TaxID=1049789 RepID=T0GK63_9LEPT|nr:plastocyanin/azurin family copper-binding protein [Leptospira broomii]EQA47154.1 periplasmic copper-binding protein NosD [Leptospira broomii serovar Hurstbridge str. 5399]
MSIHKKHVRLLPWLGLLVFGILLGGFISSCSKDGGTEGFAHIVMVDNAFSPPMQRIPIGGVIEFVNTGANPHNAISVDRSWSTEKSYGNLAMPRGAKVKVTFPKEGVFPYFCSFHASPDGKQGMVGDIVVGNIPFNPAAKAGKSWKSVETFSGVTRKVPQVYPTIQNAVDASSPGDLVLISEGVYYEEVVVTTPSITLRGTDRNKVILDGQFQRGNGVIVVGANGVAIENMTARNATLNGFFWTGVKGYRGSYLTAYNNGDYGIYAFDSSNGVLEHSYASGSPDSGIYVGQCYPCRAILYDLISENSALGYSGTNAGGDLYIISSIWRNNIVGLAPNSLDRELLPPERETTILNNLIYDNNNLSAPYKALEYPSYGTGVLIAGGLRNVIKSNIIIGHDNFGVAILPNLDENFWLSHSNIVEENVIHSSGLGDLSLNGPISIGNCFSKNKFQTSIPPLLEKISSCDGGIRIPAGGELLPTYNILSLMVDATLGRFKSGDWKSQPVPPLQTNIPGGVGAPVKPAIHPYEDFGLDLKKVVLPEESKKILAERKPKFGNVLGSLSLPRPLDFQALLFRWFGYILPMLLYVCLTSLSVADLIYLHPGRPNRFGWLAFIAFVPYLGGASYLLFGKSEIPKWLRHTLLGTGFGFSLGFLIILAGIVVGSVGG